MESIPEALVDEAKGQDPWLSLGKVISLVPKPNAMDPTLTTGQLYKVQMNDGRTISARVGVLGGSIPGTGAFFGYSTGAQVLVAFPDREQNDGIILAGLMGGLAIDPIENRLPTGGPQLIAPLGVTLRTLTLMDAHPIVMATLLPPLSRFVTWLVELLGQIGLAPTGDAIPAVVSAAMVEADTEFVASLEVAGEELPDGSIVGAPYASPNHKVTL